MTVLADRLRGIVKPARVLLEPGGHARPDVAAPVAKTPALGHEIHLDAEGPDPQRCSLDAALRGFWQEDSGGARCYIVERREVPDARHGRVQVGSMAETLRCAEREAPLLANGAPARLPFVFFDLETTGLSGGAGTYAFLVGLGWFDASGAFVTRQHLLTRASGERSMLQAVARHLEAAGAIVSFNGRSFDAPLLESRFSYHRLPWTVGRLPHLDVLHPSRRFWRPDSLDDEVASCSLGALERSLLGTTRIDDIPGFEAPARYFRFVRTGDARHLAGVLEHNRLDLLSLAGVAVRLLRLVHEGPHAAEDGREAVALGRVFERAGLPTRAIESYERAMELAEHPRRAFGATSNSARGSVRVASGSTALMVEALRALAHLERRGRRHEAAAERWEQLLEMPGCPPSITREATEALAIHHEHRTRNLETARAFALRTLDNQLPAARGRDVQHRLARIDRKRETARQGSLTIPTLLDEPILP